MSATQCLRKVFGRVPLAYLDYLYVDPIQFHAVARYERMIVVAKHLPRIGIEKLDQSHPIETSVKYGESLLQTADQPPAVENAESVPFPSPGFAKRTLG